ncbi:MAG: hypothetical protein M2R45_04847 [Verrucomicrobia subdivision 3 bacterium]|nr:hypothetical protein [Limisphaerales bacterium]MCS1416638.1 hypothetical protein [Limisphaerales bacterium]
MLSIPQRLLPLNQVYNPRKECACCVERASRVALVKSVMMSSNWCLLLGAVGVEPSGAVMAVPFEKPKFQVYPIQPFDFRL